MTNHAHRIATGLPSTWHEVKDSDGTVLYWRREHSGYEVHPCYGQFDAVLAEYGVVVRIVGRHPTLTQEVACVQSAKS